MHLLPQLTWLVALTLLTVAVPKRAAAQACGNQPDVLIVYDRSGSMYGLVPNANGGSSPKYQIAQSAVTSLVDNYSSTFQMGLVIFPATIGPPKPGNDDVTDAGRCAAGTLRSAIGPSNTLLKNNVDFNNMTTTYGQAYDGDTPTAQTLNAIVTSPSIYFPTDTRAKYVILITDGAPTCGGQGGLDPAVAPSDAAVAAVTSLLNSSGYGIKTFVIGFNITNNSDQTTLSRMAAAGGTGQTWFNAANETSLNQAIATIVDQTTYTELCGCGGTRSCLQGQFTACQDSSNSNVAYNSAKNCTNGASACGGGTQTCQNTDNGGGHGTYGTCSAPNPGDPRPCGCGGTQICGGGGSGWGPCLDPNDSSISRATYSTINCTGCDPVAGNNGVVTGSQVCQPNGTYGACSAIQSGKTRGCNNINPNKCGKGTQACDVSNGGWGPCTGEPTSGQPRSCSPACGGAAQSQTCTPSVGWSTCPNPNQGTPRVCGCNGTQTCLAGGYDTCHDPADSTINRSYNVAVACSSNGKNGNCGAKQTCQNTDSGGGHGTYTTCSGPATGDPRSCFCDGTQICQTAGWDVCSHPSSKDCTNACGPGALSCNGSAWVNCTAPADRSTIGCDNGAAPCGTGNKICNVATGYGACNAPKPGDPRNCTGYCGDTGQEHCDATTGYTGCNAKQQGDTKSCAGCTPDLNQTGTATGTQLCQADHTYGACTVPQLSSTRVCSNACGNGDEFCTPSGWRDCTRPAYGAQQACGNACGPGVATCDPNLGFINCTQPKTGDKLPCATVCEGGTRQCDVNVGLAACTAAKPSNACGKCGNTPVESCNGIDDDCNGKLDDNAICPQGQICNNGACHKQCLEVGACASGEQCIAGLCQAPSCNGVSCTNGTHCEAGICVNPCTVNGGVSCPSDRTCFGGSCIKNNCYTQGCPADSSGHPQLCIDYVCKPDACAGVTCQNDQYCEAGACKASCANVTCEKGQVCSGGTCVAAPCGGCPADTACVNGTCINDLCFKTWCDSGRVCITDDQHPTAGCIQDPCSGIICPANQFCRTVDLGGIVQAECYAQAAPPHREWIPAPGADDGSSSSSSGGSSSSSGGVTGNQQLLGNAGCLRCHSSSTTGSELSLFAALSWAAALASSRLRRKPRG